MYTRVCGILGLNFDRKNALRSSRRFLVSRSHGPTGLKMGSLFGYTFPFEGNWNNVGEGDFGDAFILSLDIPSRLKGIETNTLSYLKHDVVALWIYLPVWRELKLDVRGLRDLTIVDLFGYTFPFEGNWNADGNRHSHHDLPSLDIPSRLKGIETFHCYISFRFFNGSLDIPSRLKGIET